jgi:uncharacterized repeat protein (TIGR01451 family)
MASGVGTALDPAAFAVLDNIFIEGCPPPTGITKVFNPATIAVGQTSTLTFTLNNPSLAVTGVAFTDDLPSGLQVANPTGVSTSNCGAPTFAPVAGATSLSFSGGSIAAGGTCTVTVDVLATGPDAPGVKLNVSGNISTTQTGTNFGPSGSATAELVVLAPPSISKNFQPGSIPEGGSSLLQFTIVNPNLDTALTGVAFTDNFPAGVVVADPNGATTSGCGLIMFNPLPGATSVGISGGTIAPAGVCTVNVRVTAATAGSYLNTSGNVSANIVGNGNTASSTLTVTPLVPGISVGKNIGLSDTGPWLNSLALVPPTNVYYRFTIENTGTAPLSGVTLTDNLISTAACPPIPNPLPAPTAANENHLYECILGPFASVAGTVINTAEVEGTYNMVTVSDTDSATYQSVLLQFSKEADRATYTNIGDIITYTFTITNSGPAILGAPVIVNDDQTINESCAALSSQGNGDNFLNAAESIVCTATYTVTATDLPPDPSPFVVNVAFATVGGFPTPEDTAVVIHETVPVTLSNVDSFIQGGELVVRFGTVAEAGTLGFRVLVDSVTGSRPQPLSSALTMATGEGMDPQRYEVRGPAAGAGRFWIEEHTVIGAAVRYGPYAVAQKFGEEVTADLIDWAGIASEQQGFRRAQADVALAVGRSGGVEAELRVARSGWVSVSHADLLAAGIDYSGVALTDLRLSRGGETVGVRWNQGGSFGPQTTLSFLAEAIEGSLYTRESVYRLNVEAGAGRSIGSLHAPPAALGVVDSAPDLLRHAPDRNYSFSSPLDDPWYARRITRNSQTTAVGSESFSVPAKVEGALESIRVVLWGGTDYAIDPDHSGAIKLNGQLLENFSFDGVASYVLEATLPAGLLQAGENELRIELTADTPAPADVIYLESIEVGYERQLLAVEDQLDFAPEVHAGPVDESLFRDQFDDVATLGCPANRCAAYSVGGFSSPDIRVLRTRNGVTDELAGVAIEADGASWRARFALSGREGDRVWLTAAPGYDVAVRPALPAADLLAGPVDFLIISHPSFIGGLDDLVAARQAQGFSVRVVDVEQVYRQYSDGVVGPDAIDAYLAEIVPRRGVRYVLLVGGDTYDYFNHSGANSVSFLPTHYRPTSPFVRYAPTDAPFADTTGDDLSDVAIGRLPVRTMDELATVIGKTLAYPTAAHAGKALLVSDRERNGVRFADLLAPLVDALGPNWTTSQVRLDSYATGSQAVAQARAEIAAQVGNGQALLGFFGHSAPATWSQESLVTASQVYNGLLQNASTPTAVWQLGCYGTYFVSPNYNTIAHAVLLRQGGGAAAVIGAGGLTAISSDLRWIQTLGPRLQQQSLGEAMRDAQRQLTPAGQFTDIIVGGNILGDPSLQLRQ